MQIEELKDWQEEWSEKLYKREYENLPDFMIDCLHEYFENNGNAKSFNKKYSFGSNKQDIKTVKNLVKEEYKEFLQNKKDFTWD